MLYRYLIDNTNRIHSLWSDAEADADAAPERARDYRIKAAFLACDTFNRLLYDSEFQQSLKDCSDAFLGHRDATLQFLSTSENSVMLGEFLNAERRILNVAGMNEDAADYLLHRDNAISVLNKAKPDLAEDPLVRERVLYALRVRRDETCSFAKKLRDERKEAEAQKQAKAQQKLQEEQNRKFKRRMYNGIGGSALVTLNSTVSAGLLVLGVFSAGTTAVVSVPIAALSGAFGGGLINEAIKQRL